MIGDKLLLKPYHLTPAIELFSYLKNLLSPKFTICIGGESGCGKSTLAIALKKIFDDNGVSSFIFHMDDYFYLPPTSNHNQRLEDINHVGPQEVNLSLLQEHINQFKNGTSNIIKPLVHYKENEIREEHVNLQNFQVLIIEGTYTLSLDADFKIFMSRNYHDTLKDRIERARDPLTPFVEEVLEIEHLIISKHACLANAIVDKEYNIKFIN